MLCRIQPSIPERVGVSDENTPAPSAEWNPDSLQSFLTSLEEHKQRDTQWKYTRREWWLLCLCFRGYIWHCIITACIYLMKDGLQLTDTLPQLLVFGTEGLQLIGKLPLLLPDDCKLPKLMLGLQVLTALLLHRENKILEQIGCCWNMRYSWLYLWQNLFTSNCFCYMNIL